MTTSAGWGQADQLALRSRTQSPAFRAAPPAPLPRRPKRTGPPAQQVAKTSNTLRWVLCLGWLAVSVFWGVAAVERVLRIQASQRAQGGHSGEPFSLQGAWREIGRVVAGPPVAATPATQIGADSEPAGSPAGETRSKPFDVAEAQSEAGRQTPLPIDAPAPEIVRDRASQTMIIAHADMTVERRRDEVTGEREMARAAASAAPMEGPDEAAILTSAMHAETTLVSAGAMPPLAGASIAAMTRHYSPPLTTAAIETIVALPRPDPPRSAPSVETWPDLLPLRPLPPPQTASSTARARTSPEAPQRVAAPAPAAPPPRAKQPIAKSTAQAPKSEPAVAIGSSMFEAMRRAAP